MTHTIQVRHGGNLLALHAPDGLFSLPVNVVFAVAVIVALFVAVRAVRRTASARLSPLMGIMAAFIFAAQMVNFPIAGGTTGHLLGGVLAAVLLGPAASTIVLATVIFFQALLGDGGVTTLGPNIFNMGVLGTAFGYLVYRTVLGNQHDRPARVIAAAAFASWVAVVLASISVSLQLAASGTVTLDRALPVMVGVHMLIGVGEAVITACIVSFVLKTRPSLLYQPTLGSDAALSRAAVGAGLAAALVIGALFSLLPNWWDYPDGLESVGIKQGFLPDEPQFDHSGRLLSLPAYPLGVRLAVSGGQVTAVHRYDAYDSPLQTGDIIEQIGPKAIASLTAAAEAVGFNPQRGKCELAPGTVLQVRVLRNGQPLDLELTALAGPKAAEREPLVALMPGYTFPGTSGLVGTSLAGGVGTIIMFAVSRLLGRVLTQPGRLAQALQTPRS